MGLVSKIIIVAAAIGLVLLILGLAYSDRINRHFDDQKNDQTGPGISGAGKPAESIEQIMGDLTIPWGLAFLPGDDILITERQGTLIRIGGDKQEYTIEAVHHIGEGGLLGVALHPDFINNQWIYLYLTTAVDGGLENRVDRYRLSENRLTNRTQIIAGIPGAPNHDGGRMAFGPDDNLYITTGDAGKPDLAQDTQSLAGKILRVKDDGAIPEHNPFGNAVYSYGHRNVQGITWDNQRRLWATEHGQSGAASGYDELNLIERGANYGWPEIQGDEVHEGMKAPVAHSGPNDTWAPAGLAYANGSLFFAGLRGSALYEAEPKSDMSVQIKTHYKNEYGRLRAVKRHGDNLYITTSNTDGRGTPRPGDDRLIRFSLSLFQ